MAGSFYSPSSKECSLPKAFQTNAKRLFGFFNAHPLNQASLFRGLILRVIFPGKSNKTFSIHIVLFIKVEAMII
jgi:hypothetical protein